jgi:hypothetical protein
MTTPPKNDWRKKYGKKKVESSAGCLPKMNGEVNQSDETFRVFSQVFLDALGW